ncbi:hypothetical protein FS749_016467 [Ceratobasidium sp. UAMH 11750]|nr:hypothetical protein FS749_016467 [Ceratobasidium sp. UAMH 11750]
MQVITLNYDPLDCTCWALPGDEYCTYCSTVCDAALDDYKGKVGEWAVFSFTKLDSVAMELEEAAHQTALAEFFEEGWAPTSAVVPDSGSRNSVIPPARFPQIPAMQAPAPVPEWAA